MAPAENTENTESGEKVTVRFAGMSGLNDRTESLILEGSYSNPKVEVERGKTFEATEDEIKELRASGVVLRKLSEEQAEKVQEKEQAQITAEAEKRGADQINPNVVQQQREQQKAQQPPAGEKSNK